MDELSQQFSTAYKGYQDIDQSSLSSISQEYQQLVRDAFSLFSTVAELISQLSVFSRNEELDDIATDSLKYILTPYYQAELQLLVVDNERLDHLSSAKGFLAHFLQHCERLKLVHKDDLNALYSDKTENPTERRATLIARAKREKEIKAKMEELQKQISHANVVDEEVNRGNWIAIINYNIIKAISQMECTEKELKVLEFAAQQPPVARDSRGNVLPPTSSSISSNYTNRPVAYTILPGGQRQELAAGVFRPGYNMATMTPEQAFEAEVRAGRMITGGGNQSNIKENSEDEDEDNDEKVKKARAWDEFKDDHPYGSGNTKR